MDTSIDSYMPTAQQQMPWPCALPPEAPRQAHSAYLRAVVSALGPHAGATYTDDALAGPGPDGEEITLLELFIDIAGVWTLMWNQVSGWEFSVGLLDDCDDEPKKRQPLITGAIVPPAEAVVRAAVLLAVRGNSALPCEEVETPAAAEAGPEQQDFLAMGFITSDTARRLATYSRAESSAVSGMC
ncbi:hypothetical protein [Streptomyces prasinus]|uniref:hypothetical protein n=1 Tax=Streptomyces prasinus TaxID=67345 RepID=UPI0006EB4CD4|nr:hypothetical protein [Streptomyces prasinus]